MLSAAGASSLESCLFVQNMRRNLDAFWVNRRFETLVTICHAVPPLTVKRLPLTANEGAIRGSPASFDN